MKLLLLLLLHSCCRVLAVLHRVTAVCNGLEHRMRPQQHLLVCLAAWQPGWPTAAASASAAAAAAAAAGQWCQQVAPAGLCWAQGV
jgi:hypothetical protein